MLPIQKKGHVTERKRREGGRREEGGSQRASLISKERCLSLSHKPAHATSPFPYLTTSDARNPAFAHLVAVPPLHIILLTPEALLRCLVFPLVCRSDSEPRLSPLGSSVVRCSDLLLACHRAPRSLSLGDVAFSMLMVWVSDLCTEYEFFPKLMFVLSCGSLTMETLGTFIKSAFLNTSG